MNESIKEALTLLTSSREHSKAFIEKTLTRLAANCYIDGKQAGMERCLNSQIQSLESGLDRRAS